jgi:hypothetical protein
MKSNMTRQALILRPALFLFWVLMYCNAVAQRYDYTWLTGYDSYGGISDTDKAFGITNLDFGYPNVQLKYDSLGMNFNKAGCSLSDREGNLLFYSNGNYVANKWDEKIDNSDSLSAGYFTNEWDPSIAVDGQRYPRQIMAIPYPNDRTSFLLFNILVDSVENAQSFLATKILYASKFNFNPPMFKGNVLIKKQILIDTLPSMAMAANQHANGRDWWLIGQLINTTKYYRFLITPFGIDRWPDVDVASVSKSILHISLATFSPDGDKFADLTLEYGISIYDFDRCTGQLNNRIDIPLPELLAESLYGISVTFSPNSRFLYVGATDRIYQYDMSATDIAASKYKVATYDGFYDFRPILKTYFANSQLAPDGKIYYSTGNGTKYYHVIERPDELRDSCKVRQHGLKLKAFSVGIPYYPNYRLGALAGSPCDTLPKQVGIGEVEGNATALRVYPMPAQTEVTIDYGELPWSRYHNVRLEITDALGSKVYDELLPQYSAYQKVDVSGFAAGSYMVVLRSSEGVVSSERLVKQ